MTPLSPARKAAEEFASVVDGSRRGDVADRYAELLSCVDVLRDQEIPAPRTDFVADLRMRLMDAADTLLLPADAKLAPVTPLHSPSSRRQRRISIAAAAFVVIGGTAGVAAAAESALPGDPLYPLKRGIETAQVSLNASDSGKGQDLLRQASTRLDEVDGLLGKHQSADDIANTLSAFRRSASDGADKLFVSYQRDGDPQDISNLRAMLGSQLSKLDALAAEAPLDAKPAFADTRNLLLDLDQQASVLCADCGPGSIADTFRTTSAPQSLGDLLGSIPVTTKESRANAADERTRKLVDRANNIAKHTPKGTSKAPTGGATPPATDPVTDPVTPIVPPTNTANGLTGVLSGLTGGVTGLLGDSPLTDTLDTTLDGVTSLLK